MAFKNVQEQIEIERMAGTGAKSPMEPVSRTYQYRKVMKPMLERKRRARINRCLDELKDLMVTALTTEGENVSKLEKADILELTVRHLHKLKRQQRLATNPMIDTDRFRAGFTHAADEVSRCLASLPGIDVHVGTKLMTHLGYRLNEIGKSKPLTVQVHQNLFTPPASPSFTRDYGMAMTPPPSTVSQLSPASASSVEMTDIMEQNHFKVRPINQLVKEDVWRPW